MTENQKAAWLETAEAWHANLRQSGYLFHDAEACMWRCLFRWATGMRDI